MGFYDHSIQHTQDSQADQPSPGGPQGVGESVDDIAQGGDSQTDRQQIIPADGQQFFFVHRSSSSPIDNYQPEFYFTTGMIRPRPIRGLGFLDWLEPFAFPAISQP